MPNPTKLAVRFASDVNLNKPRHVKFLWRYILEECLPKHPEFCEGVIEFEGVEHFFTYQVVKGDTGDVVELCIAPRDFTETILNLGNLSTHEPWSPWPGRRDKRWGASYRK